MFRRLLSTLALLAWSASVSAQSNPVAKISVLSNGTVMLNGRQVAMAVLDAELKQLKASNGIAWYYRENAQAEPQPEAMAVVELIVKYQLPVSLSSKPDFSDTIDSSGRSQPRKP